MKKTFAFLCFFIAIALLPIASFAQSSGGSNFISLQDSNANPDCKETACTLYCPYGYIIDSNGCEICDCIAPPEKGELLLFAVDYSGNPIQVDLVAVIYDSKANAVEKLLVSYGKANTELSEGSYTVVVSDYANLFYPAKTNFSISAGELETVKVIMKEYPANVCGNGVCDSGETIDSCPADCATPPMPAAPGAEGAPPSLPF